ncbi:oxygen-dependent protoporphyrinogen oxidase [Lipingzhangella halophila]|uniref:Coproporphyrinogen III oxidase n=1 Tax=Lipingzhangella halophila TaxID=1783352 RepID=A0A7W7RHT7_9ACTN|nr:protoporphyrinogen oxidase [Lipingzhangella halophila]MBB4932152.1 oxygen-dependent protoporphyrinogen oxidase [Lipingzhangella halophila]
MQTKPHVAVVGGGVSGLTAAYRLTRAGADVTVLEASPRLGGKLDVSPVAGVPVDSGAESILARRPEALDLIHELGLDDRLAYPAPGPAAVYSRGRLRPFPTGQVMGVPGSLTGLARSRVLSWPGTLRAARDLLWPRTPVRGDVAVGRYIGTRMGSEVVERLVEPILGGVYAGRADQLSLDATLPQVARMAREERSLLRAVAASRRQGAQSPATGPAFATLRGGAATLIEPLARQSGARIETSATVRELDVRDGTWSLTVGCASDPRRITADGVVLACPAPATARLLRPVAPAAAAELAGIDYASMAIVTLAYPTSAFGRPPMGSGFLVPAREQRFVKAVTFSSVKWPWLAAELRAAHPDTGMTVVRCSVGRYGDEAALQRGDGDLVERAAGDLADICGVSGAPLDQRVTRWGGGLPQYTVGHQGRVDRARTAVAELPGLALCGAAYDGVGIPACVGGAAEAAREVLRERPTQRTPRLSTARS